MRLDRGFSLIELLIVVAIILIIAAIAIPNLLTARISANESAAVSTVRTINTAQLSYQLRYNGYADDLVKLGGNPNAPTANAAGIVDWLVGCAGQPCPKGGYNFAITNPQGVPVYAYSVISYPMSAQTGRRSFCSDQLSNISQDPNGNNPPVCTTALQ
jgi:type IV pilus assembly protein PilA